jgi:arylsulfatase A-like enzyme
MSKQPNILMLVTDQEHAHQSLPAGFVLSNRDRIHSRGVTFANHHATTTVCTPSRSVMITGRHAPHTSCRESHVKSPISPPKSGDGQISARWPP